MSELRAAVSVSTLGTRPWRGHRAGMIHALVKPAVHLIALLMARPGRLAVRLVEIVAFESVWPPREGVYLTDGTSLFQLQRVPPDRTGKRLLALEDCRTLEVIYCAPGALYGRGLRLVNAPTVAPSGG